MVRNRPAFGGDSAASIARAIEDALHAGRLSAGQALPTIRETANSLQVSPGTVAAAYRLLRSRGLAAGDGRRGTRLRPQLESRPGLEVDVRPPRGATPDGTVDLANGNPDPALLPSIDAALRQVPRTTRGYGTPPHLPALVTFAAGEFAVDGVPAAHLTVTNGGLDAIERVTREHLRPGDRVAVEDPGFPPLIDLLHVCGFFIEPFEVDDGGPLPSSLDAALRRGARAVVITTRAQNPFGAAIGHDRQSEVRQVLRRYADAFLIENDPAGPVAGAPAVTFCDGARRYWAVVRSTAKFLGPDLRLALVAGDALTIDRVRRRYSVGPRWVSHILQQMAVAMWADPASGRMLARASALYAERRTRLIDTLTAQGVRAHGRSGLNVWIPVPEESRVIQGLAARGWTVAAGERFRSLTGPAIRVTTSALGPAECARFAQDLVSSLRPADALLA